MITSPSPFLLGSETEVLPKGHLGFLGLSPREQKVYSTLVNLKKETLRAKLSKALTKKLKLVVTGPVHSVLKRNLTFFFHSHKTSESVLLLASPLYL